MHLVVQYCNTGGKAGFVFDQEANRRLDSLLRNLKHQFTFQVNKPLSLYTKFLASQPCANLIDTILVEQPKHFQS